MNPIERVARRVDSFQQGHTRVAFLFAVTKKFGDDNAGTLVSNLAYSAFGAIFPLLLLLVTVLGLVLGNSASARRAVLHSTLSQFPVIGTELGQNIHALQRGSAVALVVSLVMLLWGTTGVAQAGLFTMAQIWNLPGPERPNYIKRVARSFSFLAVIGLGLIVTTFAAGFGTFGHHNPALGLVGEAVALVVNIGQYFLAFRTLTPKAVETRHLWPGAVIGGVGWTILQAAGGYLIGHDLRNDSAVYGVFGLVLGLLAWVYIGVEMSVYAAEVNTVLARKLWPRGMVQPPLTEADQRSMALQATQNQRRPEQHVTVDFSEEPMSQDDYARSAKE
ncbi:MAG: YihY/virulence factor BrkB family protein [Acidimicrobiales bacterium]